MSSPESEKQIKVRRMAPEDVDRVVEITRESPGAAQWTRDMYGRVKEPAEKAWVAEYGDRPTGFLVVRVVTSEAEILNLAVDQRVRRKGIARALLQEALRELRNAEVRSVCLEVRESNAGAGAFYGGLGFETYAKRPGYYHNPEEGALCMRRKLLGQDQVPT
jgi:ribosomal-protein-alanine acetyltransferase